MATMTHTRNSDPITSKMAADSIKPMPTAMLLLSEFAKKSMTAEMASDAAGGIAGYWKRVSDLKNMGYIEPRMETSGKPKPLMWKNRSGRKALVFKITNEGRAALKAAKSVAKVS